MSAFAQKRTLEYLQLSRNFVSLSAMKRRVPHKNEVDNLVSVDGKTVFSIRKRNDGNYEFYVEILQFDNEEDVYYWSQDMLPRPSIFGSIMDAKAEVITQFSEKLKSN